MHEGPDTDNQRVFYSDRIEIAEEYRGSGISRGFIGKTLEWGLEYLPEKFGDQPVLVARTIKDGVEAPEGQRAPEGRQIKNFLEHLGFKPVRDEVLAATGDVDDIANLSYWQLC